MDSPQALSEFCSLSLSLFDGGVEKPVKFFQSPEAFHIETGWTFNEIEHLKYYLHSNQVKNKCNSHSCIKIYTIISFLVDPPVDGLTWL